MEAAALLDALGYADSPHFLAGDALSFDPDYGHLYRKAAKAHSKGGCSLRGVYSLRGGEPSAPGTNTPVVYLCEANSTEDADLIHRKVWNQNIVPFLLVHTARELRLYSGFKYKQGSTPEGEISDPSRGVLRAAIQFNQVGSVLDAFRAESIDNGELWRQWNRSVTPETRVDWRLLSSLDRLDKRLLAEGIANRSLSHALIGKFVYLHYLRSRDILSDRKLAEWSVRADDVLSGAARLQAFRVLLRHLDEWLNGSVFPLPENALEEIGEDRLRLVAGVFKGDTPEGQLHLDFDAYDFYYIPIETLSVIYEQFLHAAEHVSGVSKGRDRGAYYTPVPLANFMLDTLDRRKPLCEGMRVLDPSCGSGVFLVQCYRKLIERRIKSRLGEVPRPAELSDLLTSHLYGIDSDPDACQVAELSLILTLLDYVNPPDLSEADFQLPNLRNRNIYQGKAFDLKPEWAKAAYQEPYDWVVGNPPWKELKKNKLDEEDEYLLEWMHVNHKERPVGGNQVAELFAWQASELVATDGVVGLLLPAMTLFKYESTDFRKNFLKAANLWAVANFSNLAEILFAGRSRAPAAAFFYSRDSTDRAESRSESIEFYSPFVANQVVHNPGGAGTRKEIWTIVVNSAEIRDVPYRDVRNGSFLPWKIAFWGLPEDQRILTSLARRLPTLGGLEKAGLLTISEGLQLRRAPVSDRSESVEELDVLPGLALLDVKPLARKRFLFEFPSESIGKVVSERTSVREGRYKLPISVCEPPHIVVSAGRNFAVYSDEFLIVPPRQIGIALKHEHASKPEQKGLLKALALYLNSDFVAYHQFLTTPQMGVKHEVGTLQALRNLTVPFDGADHDWTAWQDLHEQLRLTEKSALSRGDSNWYTHGDGARLLEELNLLVNEALGLDQDKVASAAVRDLVHVRRALVDGQVGSAAIGRPDPKQLQAYALMLQDELDAFLEGAVVARHKITVIYETSSAMAEVDLLRDTFEKQPVVIAAGSTTIGFEFRKIRAHLLEKRSQWVYFERNLRMYEDTRTYLFKPMQHIHWTETQAIADASSIIADTLSGPG